MSVRDPSPATPPDISALITRCRLRAVFQPIVDFADGAILGYEGLIRGPAGSPLETPAALFARAQIARCTTALEHAAARTCIDAFVQFGGQGKLFLNFSADALRELTAVGRDASTLFDGTLDARRIVIELTEQSAIDHSDDFTPVVDALRSTGAQFALDDYGTANSSMNLWVRLQPDVVKIDRFFIDGISKCPLKFEAVRAMQHFGQASGARLVAEGIESEADLIVLRDMGIVSGQGYFFGRPETRPALALAHNAREAIRSDHIAVFPEAARRAATVQSGSGAPAAKMIVHAPTLPRQATNNDVLQVFNSEPELHALAVVEDGKPIALINRRAFMDRYALPYHRELFGKKACMQFANASPVLIEQSMTVEQMATLLASDDQRYLADGFVITDNGRYLGLGTGESLVRAVTEVRIQAARYANPLTFLPGNIPISSHIERLLSNDAGFHACYVDLNQFKPFNDQYGYWQGDEVLKYAATVLADACDPTRDFLGHVGGDDFLILFQSETWLERAQKAIETFNAGTPRFYANTDRLAGGIRGEDRQGNPMFFGFVTMAIGCVYVAPGSGGRHTSEAIASLAAIAKGRAKQDPSGLVVIDGNDSASLLPAPRESTAPAG